MKNVIESRWLGDYKIPPLELRAATEDTSIKQIIGHAAVFNRNSQNLGGFIEQVAPGAFTKTIGEADVRALINHDPNLILGRNVSDTLTLEEDDTGLAYEITPPDTSVARDWLILMERGDITQSSFSFRPIDVEWGLTSDDFPLRRLLEVALYDVSPVTFPAYPDADSGVSGRAALADLAERRSLPLREVLELAAHGELRDLIKDGERKAPLEKPEREHMTVVSRSKPAEQAVETREAAQELHEARDIDPVPGSYEAISEGLEDAIEEWAEDNYGVTWVYVSIDATFPDTVVATVYCSAVDWEGVTFQFPYTVDADDKATLGDPEQVQLTLSITPADPERSDPVEVEKRSPLSIQKARLELMRRAPSL